MNELTISDNRITSLELLAQINLFRKEEFERKKELNLPLSKYEEKHNAFSELRHDNLLRTIRDELDEEINALKIEGVEYIDKKGEVRPMYILEPTYARRVLIRESKFVRRAVVDWIEVAAEKFKDPMALIQQGLAMLNKKFDEQNEVIKMLEEQNNRLRPIAQNYRLLFTVEKALDIGHVATLIAIKKMGRNNLFRFLRENGIITKDNRPFQEDVEARRFRLVEGQYKKKNGSLGVNIKFMVFQKGLDLIINKLKSAGYSIESNLKIEDSPEYREVFEEKSNK